MRTTLTLTWAAALTLSCAAAAAEPARGKAPAAPARGKPAAEPARSKVAASLTCVGLYSETDAGYVSFRVEGGAWTTIKVGDTIPATAEVKVTVDRDWVELTPSDDPAAVYELNGESGPITRTVADILKGKARMVKASRGTGDKPDPDLKDKLVVTQYLGRQIYASPSGDEKDVKYGDVLVKGGKVTIIAINNTLTLANASGKVTTVVGPLKFEVEKVLKDEKLYKYLNVPR